MEEKQGEKITEDQVDEEKLINKLIQKKMSEI